MVDLKRCGCGKIPPEIGALTCHGIGDIDFIIVPECCRDWLIGFESDFDGEPYMECKDPESPFVAEMIAAWNAADREQSP